MRFTISFIILLTLWVALGVQTLLGQRKEMHLRQLGSEARANAAAAAAQSAELDSQSVDKKLAEYSRQIADQERLLKCIKSSFEETANGMAELTPSADKVSIRSVPSLAEPHCDSFHFVLSVPQTISVSLRLRLLEIATEVDEARALRSSNDLPQEFDGVLPGPVRLLSGTHRIELYTHRKVGELQASFRAVVDGTQICRLEAKPSSGAGWTTRSTNWSKQKDYVNSRLPTLLKTRIDGRNAVIWVDLVGLDDSPEEERVTYEGT